MAQKILVSVVDDDEAVRRTTKLLVESFGYTAATFASVQDYLKSGLLHDTSCLILDVRMPAMDGLQIPNRLAAEGYRTPIVFITAHDDKESRNRAMQAGAIAFLCKPFATEQLLKAIRSALQRNRDDD